MGFGRNFNESYSVNVRPIIWVFPFLNVYGIFGFGQSHTEVNINQLGNSEFDMTSVVDQSISTTGFGVLVTGGVGPVWFSGDFNFIWNKPELTDNATRVNVMGLRMGHTFVNKQRPDRNLAFWVGAMGIQMQTDTYGSLIGKPYRMQPGIGKTRSWQITGIGTTTKPPRPKKLLPTKHLPLLWTTSKPGMVNPL
ncbi:MAG: hypothetical protein GXO89_03370 [Chlorobi bacterium]|nr:hypothetical protein [Chlorobiota bacterium]